MGEKNKMEETNKITQRENQNDLIPGLEGGRYLLEWGKCLRLTEASYYWNYHLKRV